MTKNTLSLSARLVKLDFPPHLISTLYSWLEDIETNAQTVVDNVADVLCSTIEDAPSTISEIESCAEEVKTAADLEGLVELLEGEHENHLATLLDNAENQ